MPVSARVRSRRLASALLWRVAMALSSTTVLAERALPRPSFYVSFEDGLKPQIAAEGTVAKYVSRVGSGVPEYAPGMVGRGLRVGHGTCQYTREGNLHPDQGTVTLWARAVGWAPDAGEQHAFFATSYITDAANRALLRVLEQRARRHNR